MKSRLTATRQRSARGAAADIPLVSTNHSPGQWMRHCGSGTTGLRRALAFGSRFNELSLFGLVALLWLVVMAIPGAGADEDRDKMNKRFDGEIALLTEQIGKSPKLVDPYSRRGDAYFFLGKFPEAVADY